MLNVMEDNWNYCTKVKMMIDNKIAFKSCYSPDKLLREPARREKKSLLITTDICSLDFFSHKASRHWVKEKCVIIKSRMTAGNMTVGNWIEFAINYLFFFKKKKCAYLIILGYNFYFLLEYIFYIMILVKNTPTFNYESWLWLFALWKHMAVVSYSCLNTYDETRRHS